MAPGRRRAPGPGLRRAAWTVVASAAPGQEVGPGTEWVAHCFARQATMSPGHSVRLVASPPARSRPSPAQEHPPPICSIGLLPTGSFPTGLAPIERPLYPPDRGPVRGLPVSPEGKLSATMAWSGLVCGVRPSVRAVPAPTGPTPSCRPTLGHGRQIPGTTEPRTGHFERACRPSTDETRGSLNRSPER
jgi:hypothetical protein